MESSNFCTTLMTEVSEDNIGKRKQLKVMFLDKEKAQLQGYVIDLKKNLEINKQMLADALASSSCSFKDSLATLNKENMRLHEQLGDIIKERNVCQTKLLIYEQMIEDFKAKEVENLREREEKEKDLIEQLSKKEYLLEFYEKRNRRVEILLLKHSIKHKDIAQELECIQKETIVSVLKSCNLMEKDNKDLSLALQKACILEKKLDKAEKKNENLNDFINHQKEEIRKLQVKVESNSRIYGLEAEKERLEQEIIKITAEKKNLYKLNNQLIGAIEESTKKIEKLQDEKNSSDTNDSQNITFDKQNAYSSSGKNKSFIQRKY